MKIRSLFIASLSAIVVLVAAGCAVSRNQETVGAYLDDSVITTRVKSRFFDDKNVNATAIDVQTLNGTVMLSGFAKSLDEKKAAERITWSVKGVSAVKNELAVRP